MKKIFTLISLFAITLAANAQLSFVYNDAPVANGATVVSDKVKEEILLPGILELYYFKPDIFLSSEKAGNITVTAEFVDEPYSICFGNCYTLEATNPSQKVGGRLDAGGKVDLEIHTNTVKSRDELKTTTIKVSAQYDGDASSKITATFILSLDSSLGIDGVEADNNAPAKTYNIGGRAANDGKGLVIIKKGNTVKKVLR